MLTCGWARIRIILLTTIFVVLAAGQLSAKKIVVKKGGKYSTINSGIAAAAAGDKIEVRAGTYQENVHVPKAMNGLQLIADGKVIVEARPATGVGGGSGIVVSSDDVSIVGFVIQNALYESGVSGSHGHGIECDYAGLIVDGCKIYNCSEEAIYADNADDANITGCELAGNNGGMYIKGYDVVVTKTTIRNDSGGELEVYGDGAKVTKCKIYVTDDNGIYVEGDKALIEKNEIHEVGNNGIYVYGQKAKVLNNQISNTDSDGIYVSDSPNSTVKDNTVSQVNGYGIELSSGSTATKVTGNVIESISSYGIYCVADDCTFSGNELSRIDFYGLYVAADNVVIDKNKINQVNGEGIDIDGNNFTITGNTISNIVDESEGIYVGGTPTLGLIQDNKISYCDDPGIYISSTSSSGIIIDGNTFTNVCISGAVGAIHLRGNGHSVTNNTIKKCGADGIYVTGDGHQVKSNVIDSCARDGIDIHSGSNNLVQKNKITACCAEGIDNSSGATGTSVKKNTLSKNRLDLANGGTGTETDNTYNSGGWTTSPEID